MTRAIGLAREKKSDSAATPQLIVRAANTLIRLGSLGSKLVFALYMGRYMGLAEMGTYGLISAYVAVIVTLVGMRFDYIVSRDIVEASPLEVTCKVRDQIIFYCFNYLVLAVALVLLAAMPFTHMSPRIACFTFALSVLESVASITSYNIISLKQPVFSNILFFIRAAAWNVPVMVLGIFLPAYRTAETIFYWWMGGVLLSLFITFLSWRRWPWREALQIPINWPWIKSGARKCLLIWLGSIGTAIAMYVDRFAVERYLTRELVGIISFYSSFAFAIQSLMYSGLYSFSYPRLIALYQRNDTVQFNKDVWRMSLQGALLSGVMAVGVGIVVPLLGPLFHRPEFASYRFILWLLLLGVWLRAATDGLYFVLYARHQDNLISIGGLLSLIPAFGCNMLFVPWLGLEGVGYSAIIYSFMLGVWRLYCITRKPEGPANAASVEAIPPEMEVQEENF